MENQTLKHKLESCLNGELNIDEIAVPYNEIAVLYNEISLANRQEMADLTEVLNKRLSQIPCLVKANLDNRLRVLIRTKLPATN